MHSLRWNQSNLQFYNELFYFLFGSVIEQSQKIVAGSEFRKINHCCSRYIRPGIKHSACKIHDLYIKPVYTVIADKKIICYGIRSYL